MNNSQPQDTSSILQALANMAKSNANATPQPPQDAPSNFPNLYGQNMPTAVSSAQATNSLPQNFNSFGVNTDGNNPYGGLGNVMPQMGGQMNPQVNPAQQVPNVVAPNEQLQQQVQIIAMLQQQGIPQEQWGPVLQAVMAASAANAGGAPSAAQQNQNYPQNQNQYGGPQDDFSRDRNGYGMRSPPGRYRRSRSRSPPGYDRRRNDSPRRRRDSPTYTAYGRGDDRSSRNMYRQRSPERDHDRGRRSDSPAARNHHLPPPGPKMVNYDSSIPPDHIKGRCLAQCNFLAKLISIGQS